MGAACQALLSSKTYTGIRDALEMSIVQEMFQTAPDQTALREQLYYRQRALVEINNILTTYVHAKDLLVEALDNPDQERSIDPDEREGL